MCKIFFLHKNYVFKNWQSLKCSGYHSHGHLLWFFSLFHWNILWYWCKHKFIEQKCTVTEYWSPKQTCHTVTWDRSRETDRNFQKNACKIDKYETRHSMIVNNKTRDVTYQASIDLKGHRIPLARRIFAYFRA